MDRFEFSNPGCLLISFEQLLTGNVSECRNKSLQTMFTIIGAAEKAGSGVDKIRQGWNSQHWRSPKIKESVQPDRVIWILPMVSLIPDESLFRLKQRFESEFQSFTPLEVQALVTADLEGYVDNARMCQITHEHPSDITKLLQNLVSEGVLIQDGQGRWTRYHLSPKIDSLHKENHSLHKENHSLHKIELSDIELGELIKIAKPARENKRLPPNQMEAILLTLCQGRFLTRKQIAELLGRNNEGLRSRFLVPMVEHDRLRLRYPEKPNRTDQAYTASAKNLEISEE